MKSQQAMMTIEVLVALVIIFLTIVMSASTVKFFNMSYYKKNQYINIYTTALSIKDKIEDDICYKFNSIDDKLNSFQYTATCKFVVEKQATNNDTYMIKLYKVSLLIEKNRILKEINYYITRVEKK